MTDWNALILCRWSILEIKMLKGTNFYIGIYNKTCSEYLDH